MSLEVYALAEMGGEGKVRAFKTFKGAHQANLDLGKEDDGIMLNDVAWYPHPHPACCIVKGASKGWAKAKALWARVSGVFKRMDSPSSVVDQAERTIAATQLRFEAARQRVAVTLHIEILPGFEFPIFLLSPP